MLTCSPIWEAGIIWGISQTCLVIVSFSQWGDYPRCSRSHSLGTGDSTSPVSLHSRHHCWETQRMFLGWCHQDFSILAFIICLITMNCCIYNPLLRKGFPTYPWFVSNPILLLSPQNWVYRCAPLCLAWYCHMSLGKPLSITLELRENSLYVQWDRRMLGNEALCQTFTFSEAVLLIRGLLPSWLWA